MSGEWEDCPCCGEATFPDGSLQTVGARVPCGCDCWVSIDEGDGTDEPRGYITTNALPCSACAEKAERALAREDGGA